MTVLAMSRFTTATPFIVNLCFKRKPMQGVLTLAHIDTGNSPDLIKFQASIALEFVSTRKKRVEQALLHASKKRIGFSVSGG